MSDGNENSDRFYHLVGLFDTEVHVLKLRTCPEIEGKKWKSSQMKNKNCHLLKCLLTELRSGRPEIQMVFTFIIWTVHDMDSGNAPLEKGLTIKS